MSNFDAAVRVVLANEGGLVNNENDSGGITNYGISLCLLKQLQHDAVADDIRKLSKNRAIQIYSSEFWDKAPFDSLTVPEVATAVFDAAVMSGVGEAIKMAQRACNEVLEGVSKVDVDGVLGRKTLAAINCVHPQIFLGAFRRERVAFYQDLVRLNPDDIGFLAGWVHRAMNT